MYLLVTFCHAGARQKKYTSTFNLLFFPNVSDDGIASVKQMAIDLTMDEKHVDLEFSVSAIPCACNLVTTMT